MGGFTACRSLRYSRAGKDDIKATPAEIIYGEPIRLPDEFLADPRISTDDCEAFVSRLRQHFHSLRPSPASRHGDKKTFVFRDLATATHAFVRHGGVKSSLQPAYEGPYEIIQRHPKHFNIRVKNRVVPVSLDRLKPAYLLRDVEQDVLGRSTPQVVPAETTVDRTPERVTRSGRRVRFPDRYNAST